MNIGIDMMGGDFAPLQAVRSLVTYISSGPATSTSIFCIGDESQLKALFNEFNVTHSTVHIIHASEAIGMHEHPTKALKEKPMSSIAIGFELLAKEKIDALISAGNTGAMLVGALSSIKVISGVLRPSISTIIPKLNGGTGLLLDVGLNADCKPEHLNQFAILGSLYAKNVLGIIDPKVGLLNVGEEESKGNILAQATYLLLKENNQIHFVGNIEGRDIFMDKADVIVCDGFTGNIILKMAESIFEVGAQRKIEDKYINRFDYENQGGTPILGVSKPVIIGHGISKEKAFYNMILLAEKMIQSKVCDKIVERFKA